MAGLPRGGLSADGAAGEADEPAERAVTTTRELGERGAEALALRVKDSHRRGCPGAPAAGPEELYRQGLALAAELDMCPLVAHCHLGRGKLHARRSERAKAAENLAVAATMYREMNMRYWQAEAEQRASA